ncbi:hypothetical protein OEZ85_002959 [Tetradesmus obliquus]|uniref:Uncharacterized protein n=1 Tax=Tetradesmus obliquus TaxID=3088 RepID=A0ABY8U445_TETOB|nr:hypothetical protein OEZ85_002959 [Tetradesmus obliquus]
MPPPMPSHDEVVGALLAGGPTNGEDRSQWLLPCAVAFDWMDRGGCDAMVSLLWTLSLGELPPGKEPRHLVRLTPRNIVLALLAAVLTIVVNVFVIGYMLGCFITQGCACVCMISARTSRQLTPAYLAYVRALNCDNSAAPTVLKLAQGWLAYSTLWWLVTLLRVNLLLGWLWRNVLWPFLLGLVWRPRVVITVPLELLTYYCGMTCVAETYTDPVFSFFVRCFYTQVMILILGGGWQTVAMLLLATAFHLPRLPRHYLWPCFAWSDAVVTATGFLAPFWPLWWQRWLAGAALVWFLKTWAPDALQKYSEACLEGAVRNIMNMSTTAAAAAAQRAL